MRLSVAIYAHSNTEISDVSVHCEHYQVASFPGFPVTGEARESNWELIGKEAGPENGVAKENEAAPGFHESHMNR